MLCYLLFGFTQGYISFIPLKLQAIHTSQHNMTLHDTTRHDTYKCVFLCVHTNQGQKKNRNEKKKKTRRMRGNAVRVDLIWDDGERRQKEGGGKALEGGERGRGLTG